MIRVTVIGKTECIPCRAARFLISRANLRLKMKLNVDDKERTLITVNKLNLNSRNTSKIFEQYGISLIDIPVVLINDRIISKGKFNESEYYNSVLEEYSKI